MNNLSSSIKNGSWNFERPFRFESSGTLEEVVRSLAALDEGGGFFSFNRSRNDMSILPMNDGYTFRYRIRRRNKGSSYTTAYGEGQIWEDPTGEVIVEGKAQIDTRSLYGSMALLIFVTLIFGFVAHGFSIFPLFMMGIGAYLFFSYYQDRNRVVERISDAVTNSMSVADQFRRTKDKHMPTPEKVKNTRLSVDEVVRPGGSIWNEAISEYEDDEESQGLR